MHYSRLFTLADKCPATQTFTLSACRTTFTGPHQPRRKHLQRSQTLLPLPTPNLDQWLSFLSPHGPPPLPRWFPLIISQHTCSPLAEPSLPFLLLQMGSPSRKHAARFSHLNLSESLVTHDRALPLIAWNRGERFLGPAL